MTCVLIRRGGDAQGTKEAGTGAGRPPAGKPARDGRRGRGQRPGPAWIRPLLTVPFPPTGLSHGLLVPFCRTDSRCHEDGREVLTPTPTSQCVEEGTKKLLDSPPTGATRVPCARPLSPRTASSLLSQALALQARHQRPPGRAQESSRNLGDPNRDAASQGSPARHADQCPRCPGSAWRSVSGAPCSGSERPASPVGCPRSWLNSLRVASVPTAATGGWCGSAPLHREIRVHIRDPCGRGGAAC